MSQHNLDMDSGFSLVSTDSSTPVSTFSLVKLCQNSQLGIKDQAIGKKYLEYLILHWLPIAMYLMIKTVKNLDVCFPVNNRFLYFDF